MEVRFEQVSKRFAGQWVFRNLNLTIPSHTHFGIAGANGAGKSTLLKIIAGALQVTEGKCHWTYRNERLPVERLFRHITCAAPYAELVEEMTIAEAIRFHQQFRSFYPHLRNQSAFLEALEYDFSPVQPMHHMSSGMKQRLRLAFALWTEADLVLLDEPTTNLDTEGVRWFHSVIASFGEERTIVIASNEQADFASCREVLNLSMDR